MSIYDDEAVRKHIQEHGRPSTDGCTELSCPHHGAENRRKLAELQRTVREDA